MAVCRPQSAKNQCNAAGPRREHQLCFLLGLFFLVSVIATPVRAQYRLDAFTADNGLPQNVIRGIHQTSDGYLWIATFDGLARFDGVHFTVFNKSNTPGLITNRIGSMQGTPDGDLWLGTEASGVMRYHHGSFETYGPAEGVLGNIIRGLTGDSDGHVWILTQGAIAEWNDDSHR